MGKMLLGPLRARMIEWTCWTVSLNIADDGITLSRETWGKRGNEVKGGDGGLVVVATREKGLPVVMIPQCKGSEFGRKD